MLKAALLAILILAGSASAQPIRLSSGSIDFTYVLIGDGPVHLVGSRGFSFDGFAETARVDAADCDFEGCEPGQTVSLYFIASGNDLPGLATLAGVHYTDVGGVNALESLVIEGHGSFKLPRFGKTAEGAERTKTALVSFSGEFCHGDVATNLPVCDPVKGHGVASVELCRYDGAWIVQGIDYDVR